MPPLATARIPPKVRVPEAVIGPPVKVKPVVPPEPSTLVTVPEPPPPAACTGTQAEPFHAFRVAGVVVVSLQSCPVVRVPVGAAVPTAKVAGIQELPFQSFPTGGV